MIYLDHAATTPLSTAAEQTLKDMLLEGFYGNASSTHSIGKRAEARLMQARKTVAEHLHAQPDEIFFTSGGTEAINIMSAIAAKNFDVPVVSRLEHVSVLASLKHYFPWVQFYRATCLPESRNTPERDRGLADALVDIDAESGPILFLSWINNETGYRENMRSVCALCRNDCVPVCVDATQAMGHVPIHLDELGIDMLAGAAHKFGGPQGVGILYISRSAQANWNLSPVLYGGGQERGLRGGTENVPGICAAAAALEGLTDAVLAEYETMWRQNTQAFKTRFRTEYAGEHFYNSPEDGTSILSLTIPGIESETLLLLADRSGLCISAGSACSAGSAEPSHVLLYCGLSEEDAGCTVRISQGYRTTHEDMRQAATILASCCREAAELCI